MRACEEEDKPKRACGSSMQGGVCVGGVHGWHHCCCCAHYIMSSLSH